MRLLHYNNDGEFSLTQFFHDIPRYAILSHTWGLEEITFKDITEGTRTSKSGLEKIQFCGEQAQRDRLDYFWVDTCCIDKSSSAELTEAINSMFRWYRNATKCYVYLSDVLASDHDQADPSLQSWEPAFQQSRWFTRGWTLQELIAPLSVEFFSSNGERIGDKRSLERQLYEITGIAISALRGTSVSSFSVEDRMSWAENRQTTREEDRAYSLLGIFDISMPLIYGEGVEKAFERLKEGLFKRSRKHRLDELSPVSHTFNSAKRLERTPSQSLSISSSRNPKLLDPKSLLYSAHSAQSDTPPEMRQELVTRAGNNIEAALRQSLIDQLYFTKIDERLVNVIAAKGTTCDWFLAKTEYISWHDIAQQPNHGGFLWIKGNPGTGKSTLMKFLFEKAKDYAKDDFSQIMLSFFFLARGTVEEKSTTGLYRSLLHQLLKKATDLRDSLEWMTSDGAKVVQRNGWHGEALKQTLMHAVQKLGHRSLTIFIDALDECNKNQAADMVCFFEELCDRAREAQVRLQICFSSRHYPTIVIQKGIEVILENETGHTKDIEQYIKSNLKLGKSKLKQAELLRSEILEKSCGIFLWVVLVLDILKSEYPESSISIKKIRERLKEIPPELSDLFDMILTRDGESLERLQICLKWVLFAAHPLKPQELYFAVQFGLGIECLGLWDQEDVDLEQMTTFVRNSSKGLAEVTRNKVAEVQFIHESVRDFLLGKYESQWSDSSGNFVGYGHELLRNCCLAQLNASIDKIVDIPDPLPPASKAAQLRKSIVLKFPFLEYSVLNILRHANGAQQNAIEQGDFLAEFPLQRWRFLNNTLEMYGTRRYTKSVSLLYILAEKNLVDLIRTHPRREFCFDIENERYGVPLFAALATESYEAVQTFIEIHAEIRPQDTLLRNLCKQYSENRNKFTNFGRTFDFSRHGSLSSHAAEQGDVAILTFLCALGKLQLRNDGNDRPPLTLAAEKGHTEVVKLLLENGACIETKDRAYPVFGGREGYNGRTPLLWAVEKGREAVVKLLLEKGADLEYKDEFGRAPLILAVNHRDKVVVKLLLENGADVEVKNRYDVTPLLIAAETGQELVVRLLLEKSAKLEVKDEQDKTPLLLAAEGGHKVVIKLLLEKGAKVEVKDKQNRTPLSLAAEWGHEAVVKLLLDYGAELEIKSWRNMTPLLLAVEGGHKAVVKLLLENSAELEAKNDHNQTPLSLAVRKERLAVVKLLLDYGAESEVIDDWNQTPLWIAVERRNEAIANLLVEKYDELH